jgi:hypothetical protein
MDRKHLKSILQNTVEEDIPPYSINLWPRVKERLVASKHPLFTQGVSMNRPFLYNRSRQLAALITLMFVISLTIMVATPQGRAFAQDILKFFLRIESNAVVLSTVNADLESVSPEIAVTSQNATVIPAMLQNRCGTKLVPHCSLDEVRPLVGFSFKELAHLSDGMSFHGATTYQDGVLLAYEGNGTLLLVQTPVSEDNLQEWQVSHDAIVEAMSVGKLPAEYVQGGWTNMELDEEGILNWDAQLPTQTLRWVDDGIQYTLLYIPGKTNSGSVSMDLPKLVRLATELKPVDKEAENATAIPDLTIQQVADLAGLTVVEPSWLPTGFTFKRATYSSEHNAVCLYYNYHPDDRYPVLVIAESTWVLPTVKEIQAVASYNGKEVEIASSVESITVEGANGGLATLVITGLQADKFCGGELVPANRALLWQSGNRTNIIFAPIDAYDGRGFLSRMEMRRLAENINGSNSSSTSELDPERLLSVRDAETLTGVDIKVPARMLTSVRFDHISCKNEGPYRREDALPIALMYSGQPVGDGRTYKVLIMQIPGSTSTLESLAMAGGFEPATVHKQPAIYQEACWNSTEIAGSTGCIQTLIWFEGGTEFDIQTYFPAVVPRDKIIAIAESMR